MSGGGMVVWAGGEDSWGGWTQPGPTPSDLSSCSLLQWRRERERESLVYAFFFLHSTPHREQQNDEVSEGFAIFLVSAYVIIVYVTVMNIIHSLSP